jgi:hypothetical protein
LANAALTSNAVAMAAGILSGTGSDAKAETSTTKSLRTVTVEAHSLLGSDSMTGCVL